MKAAAQNITLQEALRILDSGARFDVSFVKADKKRGTGGGIETLLGCTKHTAKKHVTDNNVGNIETQPHTYKAFAPRHFANSTRNLFVLNTRRIVKVHIRLLTRLNGKKII